MSVHLALPSGRAFYDSAVSIHGASGHFRSLLEATAMAFRSVFSSAYAQGCTVVPPLFLPLPANACLSSTKPFADRGESRPANGHPCTQCPC